MPLRKYTLLGDGQFDNEAVDTLCREVGILKPTARLLVSRGYKTVKEAEDFIKKRDNYFHNPFELKDMDKAVDRILKAKANGEKVMIYGDYDVDGVTSVSVLYLYLKSIGIDVDYHIPSRESEGYGMNTKAVDEINKNGFTLMVTVDTGITAFDEIDYANTLGIDTVVTDHHECHDKKPEAIAVVNPRRPDCKYPYKELAGVGVVFKLITALRMRENILKGKQENEFSAICNEYADLIALGTVADVMPLTDENRLIVSAGLKKMEYKCRVGLEVLLECTGVIGEGKSRTITSSTIGFTIAPRLNAAGRLADASLAVELMLCEDENKARDIANHLCDINQKRKETENIISNEALAMIDDGYDFENNPVIVLSKEGWHQGVIGIVASRITDKYSHPAILVSFDENGMGKGSGRSVKGLNLVEALSACGGVLEKFGGHELAAGLSVEKSKFGEFCREINRYAREHFDRDECASDIVVDDILSEKDATLAQAEELYLLEPYGTCNPSPVFVMCDVEINEIIGIGQNKHCRLNISKNGVSHMAVYFGTSPDKVQFCVGDKADIVFTLDVNEFRGEKQVQLNVKTVLATKSQRDDFLRQENFYKAIKNGAHYTDEDDIFPERNDFVVLYNYIKNIKNKKIFGAIDIVKATGNEKSPNPYIKLNFMLDVFHEMQLISLDKRDGAYTKEFVITPTRVRGKVNLDKSSVLKDLRTKREKA